jgi:hypothetical protein
MLEQYLSNIGGNTLEEKLVEISKFYAAPPARKSGDRKEYIRDVLSFLVFFKTLTLAITNFNASAAGFNFEAFLSVLLKGRQIPASGADTIADIAVNYGGAEVPLSLKLYGEKTLEVGGSYFDLCNDLINDKSITKASEWEWGKSQPGGGAMRYLVCTKSLSGKGIDQEGAINFYQFDITRENIFSVLIASSFGKACIKLPSSFVEAYNAGERNPENLDITSALPARAEKPEPDAVSAKYAEYLDAALVASEFDPVRTKSFSEEIVLLYNNNMEKVSGDTDKVKISFNKDYGVGGVKQITPLVAKLLGREKFKRGDPELESVKDLLQGVWSTFKQEYLKALDLRKAALEEISFLSAEESLTAYQSMKEEPQMLSLALRNSLGYIRHLHWKLARVMSLNAAGGEEEGRMASLKIGTDHVAKLVEQVRDDLMKEVFEIFISAQEMSRNLNAFFAGGLQDVTLATNAMEASKNVSTKTGEVADISPERQHRQGGMEPGPWE